MAKTLKVRTISIKTRRITDTTASLARALRTRAYDIQEFVMIAHRQDRAGAVFLARDIYKFLANASGY
jgi:hypothetical protein